MGSVESRLDSLGFQLPAPPSPVAAYVSTMRTGDLVFVSGHGPMRDGQFTDIGKLGRELDVDAGYQAARLVMLNCLASIKAEIGDLDKIIRIVRLFGMVNSAPGFDQQPAVINGASELLIEIFGDRGKHTRSAVGMAELPFGISVEIEMVVEVTDSPTSAQTVNPVPRSPVTPLPEGLTH